MPSLSTVRRDEVDDMYVLPALPAAEEKDKSRSEAWERLQITNQQSTRIAKNTIFFNQWQVDIFCVLFHIVLSARSGCHNHFNVFHSRSSEEEENESEETVESYHMYQVKLLPAQKNEIIYCSNTNNITSKSLRLDWGSNHFLVRDL